MIIKTLPLMAFLFAQLLSPPEVESGCSSEQIVYVINTLPVSSESQLLVHCEIGGQDLGSHLLYHDQDFHWSFCQEKGVTMSCQLSWGSKNLAFDAFKDSGVYVSETFWSARSDGVYLRDTVGNEREIPWNN